MPNIRSKTWTTTTPANVGDAQWWEDHLISDADAALIETAVQSVNNIAPDSSGNVDLGVTGHTIEDEDGTSMLQQPTLQFLNAEVTDDSADNKTVVDCKGSKGDPGDAATISVGTVTTLPAGSAATVTNTGSASAAVFDFGIPKGMDGSGAVSSVNGQTGTVVLEAGDIDLATPIGSMSDVESAIHGLSSGKQDVLTAGDGINIDPITMELSADLLAGSNISITSKYGALEISTIGGGGSTITVTTSDSTLYGQNVSITDGVTTLNQTLSGTGIAVFKGVTLTGALTVSTLGAQSILNAPYFGNYNVVLATFSATINVFAPSGSSITVAGNGESYTVTGAGMSTSSPVFVHSAATFAVDCQYEGVSKATQNIIITTDGQTESVTFEYGSIIVSVAADFVTAGSTITCAKTGISTISKTAASTLTFRVPDIGEYTISGTILSDTYSTTATVTALGTPVSTSLQTVPEGSTVLPTDDIQTWLNCAGIYNKTSYTTLADVLGDATTLLALMSDNNAVDYLVRSTTWATDVCADSTAMTDIGANNYCANTLLADEDWCDAIVNSTYRESVLNIKVPTMTDFTTPSGEASASGAYTTNYAWKAFDGNDTTYWYQTSTAGNVNYEFTSVRDIFVAYVKWSSAASADFKTMIIQGYDEALDTWVELGSVSDTHAGVAGTFEATAKLNHSTNYKKYGLFGTTVGGHYLGRVITLQFYGREDV